MKKLILLIVTAIWALGANQEIEVFNDNFVTQQSQVKLALVGNKKKYFPIIKKMMNSLNAYFYYKNTEYKIRFFDEKTDIDTIIKNYKDIIYFTTDKNKVYALKDYNATFYIPTFNQNDFNQSFSNIKFGLINFKDQIKKLSTFVTTNSAVVVHTNLGTLPARLLKYEQEQNLSLRIINADKIRYKYYALRNRYVFFNTYVNQTSQILANLVAKNIRTKLQLSTQQNYSDKLIQLSQPQNLKKIVLANSIVNYPSDLVDINKNFSGDFRYFWLNYVVSALANVIYNKQMQQDEFYLNDFGMYMFNNQVNYPTQIFKVFRGAFVPVRFKQEIN